MNALVQNNAFLGKKVTMEGVPKFEMRRHVVQLPVKIPGDGVTVGIAPKDTARFGPQNKTKQELLPIRRNGVALDPVDEGLMTRVL